MRGLLLALLSGVLLALLFPRYDAWWLAPMALTPLFLALAHEYVPWRRFGLGWAMGVVFWAMTCNWIALVLDVHGGMGPAGGWGTFALFCVLKSIHYGVFAMLAGVLIRHWYAPPAIALLWAGLERTQQPLTGFGWLMLGNAGIEMPIPLRLAPLTGVYGLSFLFALTAVCLALFLLKRPRSETAWVIFAALPVFLPALPDAQRPTASAVAVQPDFAVTGNWTPELYQQQKELLVALTEAGAQGRRPPDVLLWPETPTPIFYDRDADLRTRLAALTRQVGAPLVFGTLGRSATGQAYNGAQLIDAAGKPGLRYDKVFLVPFGEYVPSLFSFVNQVSDEAGAYAPGDKVLPLPVGDRLTGAFICYESAVPHHVREFARAGAEVFLNLSNDGYFFETAAREQHLQLVRMRAIENRRWTLRVTNNGITASVDPAGQVRESFPGFRAMSGALPFAWRSDLTAYSRYGDWFAWFALAVAAGCLFLTQWPNYTPPAAATEEPRPRSKSPR